MLDFVLETPLLTFSRARSVGYAAEFFMLNRLSSLLPGGKKPPVASAETQAAAERELRRLLRDDVARIRRGDYPISVLQPESPVEHMRRLFKVILDGAAIYRRRAAGKTTDFTEDSKTFLGELPRYYRRNFHFQTDGYLSDHSAEIYEHQVEMLFSGTADAMRRLVITPLRERFGPGDGAGLTFLEVGAGTGRATRFVKLAFPKARIVALDLSDFYLKTAQKRLSDLRRIDFLQGDGGKLSFGPETFDAVYSVFLFHELPRTARAEVIAEARRVLKPGGIIACVDSRQKGEMPELDPLFEAFPQAYHEPFYRDYHAHPLEEMLTEAKFAAIGADAGFLSKVCWGTKSA